MNMFSKRLVIIASFCLSAALCRADTAAPATPIVAAATSNVETATGMSSKLDAPVLDATVTNQAAVPSEVLKPQATSPVAAASQGFRAKTMDMLRGLLGACKGKSAAALGYAGSALGYAASSVCVKAMDTLRALWRTCKATSAVELWCVLYLLTSAVIFYDALFDLKFFYSNYGGSNTGGFSGSNGPEVVVDNVCKVFKGGKDGALGFFNALLGYIDKETLDVNQLNDKGILKKAYHDLALVCHPDKEGGSDEAFTMLGNAYDCLKTA
jgi:hypothetical protein